MLFFFLGLKNAWRNIERSGMVILTVIFSSGFLTYAITLSRGFAPDIYANQRSYIGGDISLYAAQIDVGVSPKDTPLVFRQLLDSPFTDLAMFQPEVLDTGFLTLTDTEDRFHPELGNELESRQGVRSVSPLHKVPAWIDLNPRGERQLKFELSLIARDFAHDATLHEHPAASISRGRWFSAEDEGKLVCILPEVYALPPGETLPNIGEKITLILPHNTLDNEGDAVLDSVNTHVFELEVIGYYQIETRQLLWLNEPQGIYEIEYIYWLPDYIYTPLATWQALWQESGEALYEPQQIMLSLDNVTFLQDTVAALRQHYPQYSVFSVVEQYQRSMQQMRWETKPRIAKMPEIPERLSRLGSFQEDLRLPISLALLATASLIIASNILILVNERRKEIAVLKAIGAVKKQIALMILSETLCIATLGGVIGFLCIKLQDVLNQMGTVALSSMIPQLVNELLVVITTTVLAGLLFGLIPAIRTAQLSTMEVMRDD